MLGEAYTLATATSSAETFEGTHHCQPAFLQPVETVVTNPRIQASAPARREILACAYGLPCCVLVNTKRTLISPQPVVAWQTKRRRGLRPSARVGVVRAHRGSMPA